MRSHSRFAAVAVATAAIAAPLVTAAPAQAATASLTAASCQASGGTYNFSKGVKTCTKLERVSYSDNYEDHNNSVTTDAGTYTASYTTRVVTSYTQQTTQTQKGKGTIQTTTTFLSDTVVQQSEVVPDSRTCTQYIDGTGYVLRAISVCEDLGLYAI